MSQNLRVSAATLAKIKLDERFLVVLNKGALRFGLRSYAPFGGALEFYAESRSFLENLGAQFEEDDTLRFSFPEENFEEFERWFRNQEGRETNPYRELREEFVDEERIFSELPEDAMNLEYLMTTKPKRGLSFRSGQNGILTQRIFEIYGVNFIPQYEETLKSVLYGGGSRLTLITGEEIQEGETKSGIKISSNCLSLIE